MTSLLFVRKPHVYLPEIPAYRNYLAANCPGIQVCETGGGQNYDAMDFDIVWHFMGLDIRGGGRFVVHEYNSLSTPPFAHGKNAVKSLVNKRPHRRIFLNERVKRDFGFRDDVPFCLRDMGIDDQFFSAGKQPVYDFILAGGLNRGSVVTRLLDCFAGGRMREMSVVLVGDAPPEMQARYKNCQNIIFKGRVAYHDMPALMGQARYGLNITPDIYPYNVQTSTKLLEYCAAGLPVVTTDYQWVRAFETGTGASFFKLTKNMDNFKPEEIDSFAFKIPPVEDLRWSNVIARSRIFSFLQEES